MQLKRKCSRVGHVARPALAGLLAVLLLVAMMVAGSHSLHRSLHRDAATPNHFCAVCLFAKGQVSASGVVLVPPVLVATVFLCLAWIPSVALPSHDFRSCPSRAPPCLACDS